jgi:hypothetical protein
LFSASCFRFPWTIGPRTALKILILATLVLRLFWSAAMEVANDEAYHYLFAVYPDWSFFDHPPMTMWIEWLGDTVITYKAVRMMAGRAPA